MTSEWLGLILNVWLFSPAGAVAALGDDSWSKRETASLMTTIVAEAERSEFKTNAWGNLKQPEWSIHYTFWNAHKGTHKDPEIAKRAERLAKLSQLCDGPTVVRTLAIKAK